MGDIVNTRSEYIALDELDPGLSLSRILFWANKGSFALLDQALFAGTNLVINILLARWFLPDHYGAFSVAFSVLGLMSIPYSSVIIEPMFVFGSGKYSKRFPEYLGILISANWKISALISLVFVSIGLFFFYLRSNILFFAFLSLGVVAPFIQVLWLLRRAFYIKTEPKWSATGGGVYLIFMLLGIYCLRKVGWFPVYAVFILMGCISLLTSVWLLYLLRPVLKPKKWTLSSKEIFLTHFHYGKWSIFANFLTWIPTNIYYLLLPLWFGLGGSAALRAVMNPTLPIFGVNIAASGLLLPLFVRTFKLKGKPGLNNLVRLIFSVFFLFAVSYSILLIFFRKEIVFWLYGGKYLEYTNLIILASLVLLPASATAVLGCVLRAIEKPNQFFWCTLVSSIISLAFAIFLVRKIGISGAIIGLFFSWLASALLMLWFYVKK